MARDAVTGEVGAEGHVNFNREDRFNLEIRFTAQRMLIARNRAGGARRHDC